jgi:predicted AAA+ superfamily ATPase
MAGGSDEHLFPVMKLDGDLIDNLRRLNPWWEGLPGKSLPPHRRSIVSAIHKRLKQRLAPIVTVRGPRQVGKTTAQLQVIEDLLRDGLPGNQILRVQCDEIPTLTEIKEPILRLTDWFELSILKRTLNQAAADGSPAYLFWDEVQNLRDWAPQLKHLVDSSTCHVIVTGSSALRIEQGRDSLAGRISTLEVGPLSLQEIAAINDLGPLPSLLPDNGLEPLRRRDFWTVLINHGRQNSSQRDAAFQLFSERGGYPIAHARSAIPWSDIAVQLNENVIKRVIEHDLRVGDRGRKRDPQLLELLFRLCCRYAGQSPNPTTLVREAQRALSANIGPQRVRQYLRFLNDTLLVRLIPPLEIRLRRTKGAPKICLADHGLRASWLQEVIPLVPKQLLRLPHLTDLAGHLAESVTGAYLSTITGLELAHLPERGDNPEVDFVLTLGELRVPLEVKYRNTIDPFRDTDGLRAFLENRVYNAPFGILITTRDDVAVLDPRILAVPLSTLLLLR